jgi:hypothetical protein
MNTRFEQRFDTLDTEMGRLRQQYTDLSAANTLLQAANTAMAAQITDLQGYQARRFDDLYIMSDDTQHYAHDLFTIEYHMARFRIDNEGVPPFHLTPHQRRTDLRHQEFQWPDTMTRVYPEAPPQDDNDD